VDQPYGNHKAGQLAFGPDGDLYVGFGDGGSEGDPQGNGQNTHTFLGKMLRIDVNHRDSGKAYAIPQDNPFVNTSSFLPEIWALGLRNPWRYSFDSQGRLIVSDVGQDTWEEIDLLEKGRNYGWNIREGKHCYHPPQGCRTQGLTDPIYEYSHDEGIAVIGGYVYDGKAIPSLSGKYVFGDFGSGRLWALTLPDASDVFALGRWGVSISTFGRDLQGELYLADYTSGKIYHIAGA
jgi:glucose/arabinose dehydrogenase